MKRLFFLLIIFAFPAFADSTDAFERLVYSLISRLPDKDKPINLCIAQFKDNDSSTTGELSTFIREELETAFSKNRKVQVITRSNLDQLELEAEFQDSDLVERSTTVSKVAVQGVEGIVRGRFVVDGNNIILYAEIIWLESGSVIKDRVSFRKPGAQEETINPVRRVEEVNKSYETSSYTPVQAERSALDYMITYIREMNSRDATMQLYQKRLLTLLPMIRNGADVNLTLVETKGNTALHYACGMGNYELVKWLVEHGADVNKRTNKGASPLNCVGGTNGTQIRSLLIQHGAIR